MRNARILLAAALMAAGSAFAAGPAQIAKADLALWPDGFQGRAAFDAASRAELLTAVSVFEAMTAKAPTPEELGVKEIAALSQARWQREARLQMGEAFRRASAGCRGDAVGCGFTGEGWDELTGFAQRFVTALAAKPAYGPWVENSRAFYQTYFREQLRLAALFPRITSEILTFDASELTGDELPDGQFLLTFDDGPTNAGGDTDRYLALVRGRHVGAFFFTLGDALDRRLAASSVKDLQRLYQGQCLASHGMEHKPHPKWTEWQASLDKSEGLVRQVTPDRAVMFRPPYGQRNEEMVAWLARQDGRVILWNIDSQDWNNRISAPEVTARVEKLMLFKRHGVVLFHDVHAKGLVALPGIFAFTDQAGLGWADCHALPEAR